MFRLVGHSTTQPRGLSCAASCAASPLGMARRIAQVIPSELRLKAFAMSASYQRVGVSERVFQAVRVCAVGQEDKAGVSSVLPVPANIAIRAVAQPMAE